MYLCGVQCAVSVRCAVCKLSPADTASVGRGLLVFIFEWCVVPVFPKFRPGSVPLRPTFIPILLFYRYSTEFMTVCR